VVDRLCRRRRGPGKLADRARRSRRRGRVGVDRRWRAGVARLHRGADDCCGCRYGRCCCRRCRCRWRRKNGREANGMRVRCRRGERRARKVIAADRLEAVVVLGEDGIYDWQRWRRTDGLGGRLERI